MTSYIRASPLKYQKHRDQQYIYIFLCLISKILGGPTAEKAVTAFFVTILQYRALS